MSFVFDELQSTVPLLMMCGYRSKVCTNPRATKLDGSLHGLCEFHRRKANASQKRLHQRQREARLKRKLYEAEAEETQQLTKKTCPSAFDPTTIDPIPYEGPFARATACTVTRAGQLASPNFTMEMTEMSVLPLPYTEFPPLATMKWAPSNLQTDEDDFNSAIV